MCWECDHPDRTHADYLEHLREQVDCCGWIVQAVARDRRSPALAYTIGLTGFREPELVVIGKPAEEAVALLNAVAAHVLHAEAPEPGDYFRLKDGAELETVGMSAPGAHLHTAVELYGEIDLRALQLVYPDARGRWPWDPGHRPGGGGQPVLGPRGRS